MHVLALSVHVLKMDDLPRKRYRKDSSASDDDFSEESGPDGFFPSENESAEDNDVQECFFPSEESHQGADEAFNPRSLKRLFA